MLTCERDAWTCCVGPIELAVYPEFRGARVGLSLFYRGETTTHKLLKDGYCALDDALIFFSQACAGLIDPPFRQIVAAPCTTKRYD